MLGMCCCQKGTLIYSLHVRISQLWQSECHLRGLVVQVIQISGDYSSLDRNHAAKSNLHKRWKKQTSGLIDLGIVKYICGNALVSVYIPA